MEKKNEYRDMTESEKMAGGPEENRRRGGKRDWRFIAGCAATAAAFALVVGIFLNGVSVFLARAEAEGAKTLRSAISRASVQCYAIEGRYPPSVDYLEEHYGVKVDRERYHIFYDGFASNIMPEITVIPVEGGESHDR